MKQKQHARQRREAEERRRKGVFSPKPEAPPAPPKKPEPKPRIPAAEKYPDQTPEEDALEFLAYLEKHGVPRQQEDAPAPRKRKTPGTLPRVNLEEGMPLVEEALNRMRMGLQEARVSGAKAVKLIHGYGSTGKGGKIRPAAREELAAMKRKGFIKGFIPGEDFGPTDAASRKLAEADRNVTRDPDYGRMNHGITVAVL